MRAGDRLLVEERRRMPRLTPRESEILALVAPGHTSAEIAAALRLAPGTVRKHLENAYAKLGVKTRTAAVAAVLALAEAETPAAERPGAAGG